jgi:hypothetical protein
MAEMYEYCYHFSYDHMAEMYEYCYHFSYDQSQHLREVELLGVYLHLDTEDAACNLGI